jgi:hypothetical protein
MFGLSLFKNMRWLSLISVILAYRVLMKAHRPYYFVSCIVSVVRLMLFAYSMKACRRTSLSPIPGGSNDAEEVDKDLFEQGVEKPPRKNCHKPGHWYALGEFPDIVN